MIDLSPGCFTIIYETQDEIGNVEPLTMYKFTKNISTMISKENLFSLHMRFLNKEERILCKDIYNTAPKNTQQLWYDFDLKFSLKDKLQLNFVILN